MIRQPLVSACGLAALLLWAPLPFGSVPPAFAAALGVATFAVLAATLATTPDPLPRSARRIAVAVAGVAAWGLLQATAWPTVVVAAISPGHLEAARASASLVGDAQPATAPLSLAPGASIRSAVLWLAAAAGLMAAASAGRERWVRRALGGALAAGALFQVLYGAKLWLVRATAIWGVEVPSQPTRLRGTFVNPNHLATYLLIAAPVAFAAVWWSLHRGRRDRPAEVWLLRLGVAALVWVLLFGGLAFTRSRAGMLAALAGILAQLALVARRAEHRRVVWGASAALVAALVFVAQISLAEGFGRFLLADAEGGFRLAAMADTAQLAARFPLCGTGLGSFRAAFPLVHPVGDEGEWWHAHNDWLELAATTGVVGVALALTGVLLLARALYRRWRDGASSEDRAAALAAIGACVAVGLQEALDFGLTIPANAVTLAIVCGAALAVPADGPTVVDTRS